MHDVLGTPTRIEEGATGGLTEQQGLFLVVSNCVLPLSRSSDVAELRNNGKSPQILAHHCFFEGLIGSLSTSN